MTTAAELAGLFDDPASAGRRAQAARAAHFGRRVLVRAAPAHPAPAVAVILRGPGPEVLFVEAGAKDPGTSAMSVGAGTSAQGPGTTLEGPGSEEQGGAAMSPGTGEPAGDPGWPDPSTLRPGDRLVLQVDRGRADAYFAYLVRLAAAAAAGLSVAPYCARAGGLFRLHLLCAARIALPGSVRVEARHDLLGIRLAQVALGFGADTLAGPLAPPRHLPLAGVTRPDEATPAGLATLVEQAGLEPVLDDLSHGASP